MGKRIRWVVLIATGFVAGCSSSPTSPTAASNYVSATRFFSGLLNPLGTSTAFTFTTIAANDIAVTVASLTDANGEPLQADVSVNLGVLSGAACSPTTATKVVASGLTATITASSVPAGTYCVSVSDIGQLPFQTNFTARVVTSTGTAPTGTASSDLMPTLLAWRGTSTKTFNAGGFGAASLTLLSSTNDVPIELAVGVWDGSACRLNTSVVTSSGTDPQITINIDAGAYCVRLADIGNLTQPATVSGTIQHN